MSSSKTVVGSLTADPTLRYDHDGTPICEFTVGDNTAGRGQAANWCHHPCVATGPMAENLTSSCEKGDRLVVTGSEVEVEYERADGSTGRSRRLKVSDVGPGLRFNTVLVEKTPRKDS